MLYEAVANTGLAKVAIQCSVGQFCGYKNIRSPLEHLW